jgi:hypothetical protein
MTIFGEAMVRFVLRAVVTFDFLEEVLEGDIDIYYAYIYVDESCL